MRRSRKLIGAAAVALLGGSVLALAGPSVSEAAGTVQLFDTTGSYDFVVPANVCELQVIAAGAQGGAAQVSAQDGPAQDSGSAGLGGRTTSTLTVTPGETLQINVGGQGTDGSATTTTLSAVVVAGSGGFNGGRDGASATATASSDEDDIAVAAASGGGGGASDVRQGGTALTDRVVVAGGGAGASAGGIGVDTESGPTVTTATAGDSGDGANPDGESGTTSADTGSGTGGGGGTQTAGGLGGDQDGLDGALGLGAFGVSDSVSNSDAALATAWAAASGGGAGGYYGGGSGGTTDNLVPDPFDNGGAGGSGGGSSFGPAGSVFDTGLQSGDGAVGLSYDPYEGTCGVDPNASVDGLCGTYEAIVFDLNFTADYDTPAGLEEYLTDFIALLDQGVAEAPADIFDQWVAVRNGVVEIDDILATVGYDFNALSVAQVDAIDAIFADITPDADAVDAWALANCPEEVVPIATVTPAPAAAPTSSTPAFTG